MTRRVEVNLRQIVAMLATAALLLGMVAPRRAQGLRFISQMFGPIPGTVTLPPHSTGGFGGPDPTAPPGMPSPGGFLVLDVRNESDQSTTVDFTGNALTVTAPQGYVVQFLSGCMGPADNPSSCAVSAGVSAVCLRNGQNRCAVGFTTVPSLRVTFPAGWNLVGFPSSIALSGAYYTLQGGDSSYQTIAASALRAGEGYWTYVASAAVVDFSRASLIPVAISIQVPSGQFVMIGNPYPMAVSIVGADAAYSYDSSTGRYMPAGSLAPGQGAWVYSAAGSTITLLPNGP